MLTIIAVIGAFQSFQRNRDAFERLDFDYTWQKETLLVGSVDPGSRAERAGLLPGDEIWLINSTPPGDIDGLRRTMRRSEEASLLVARGDETFVISYSPPPLKIDYQFLFLTFIGFLYLVIGLFTYTKGRGEETTLFYIVTILSFIVFTYSPAGKTNLTFEAMWMVEELARIFLPPVMLHFFLLFPRPLVTDKRLIAALYAVPAVLALWVVNLLVLGNLVPVLDPETSFRMIDRWEMLHFAVYFTLAFIAITWTYRNAPGVGEKKQIKWIWFGMAAGFLPFLVLYLIPFIRTGTNSVYSTIATLPLALIPLAFAVSILRYKLWDVEVVIKEALAYTITFGFGVIAFSTVNVLLTSLIEESHSVERNLIAFTSGLLIAGVLVPMKNRVEGLIEMLVYRGTWRHRRAMSSLTQELATFHDLNELIEIIRDRLIAAIEIRRVNVYIREGSHLTLYDHDDRLPEWINADRMADLPAGRVIHLERPRSADDGEISKRMVAAGYRYLFAIRHRQQLQGLLICGTKGLDERLSTDDLRLIHSLIPPLALAIENARLYGRLRAQLDQIRSLKEYSENIIESSPSAIAVIDREGLILTANSAFWNLTGTDPSSVDRIGEILPPETLDGSPGMTEISFRNRRGEERNVTISRSPFEASDAPLGASVLVMGDVSEITRLERELQEKDRLASLGLLAAGIAHEVNTPLAGISSYAQLLLAETNEDDPRFGTLKKMEKQTFRASRLVNNLLDFAANRRLEQESVDLATVISSALELNESVTNAGEIELDVSMPAGLRVRANPYELQQVVTNLLLNARDALKGKGRIEIDLRRDGDQALLTVRDEGPGVPPELRGEIFKPLVTTKHGQGGTGLGLAITERIIQASGGEIRLVSREGEGATFEVRLPLETAAEIS